MMQMKKKQTKKCVASAVEVKKRQLKI